MELRDEGVKIDILRLYERIGGEDGYRRYTSEALGYVKEMGNDGDKILADRIIDVLNEREVYAMERIQEILDSAYLNIKVTIEWKV